MSINVSQADNYFAGHVNGKAWEDFEEPDRVRAIDHARRIIETRAGAAFSDADTTIATSRTAARWDVAVYEQAFHMLKHSHLPRDGESGAPRYLETGEGEDEPSMDVERLCPAALRYIAGPGQAFPQVEMRRG